LKGFSLFEAQLLISRHGSEVVMAAPLNPSLVVPFGLGALILWSTYSRIRRMVGRQHLSNVRPWITSSVFLLLILMVGAVSIARPQSLLGLGGGLAVGIGLGVYSLRKTRFENTAQGLFYTPSAHVGIAVSLLFVGRILYRLIQMSGYGIPGGGPAPAPGRDPMANYATTPLTVLVFGVLAGYYVTYAIGLLRWKASIKGESPPAG
jgi:hypothetical protein